MLLTVEGGGFFSSSALGYSKGLSVLFLGQKNEERPMRVAPCNQYQLVEQEASAELQLASKRNQVNTGCASFICFSRNSVGVNGPSPSKTGPEKPSESLPDSSSANESCNAPTSNNAIDGGGKRNCLKSSLKKPLADSSILDVQDVVSDGSLRELSSNVSGCTERRKVQWTDACGKELVEIREFELSDKDLSDDEFGHDDRRCHCVIQ